MIKSHPLPYDKDGLSPTLSSQTFDYHYDKHYLGYVNKLNMLIKGTRYSHMSNKNIILESCKENDQLVYNNATQVWNHEFYWKSIGKSQHCPSVLMELLIKNFNSYDNFIEQFIQSGITLFGSGWIWLVQDKHSLNLSIIQTKDSNNPLTLGLSPLLTIDIWEHAYYIDYQNNRALYLQQIIKNNLQWSFAASNLSLEY